MGNYSREMAYATFTMAFILSWEMLQNPYELWPKLRRESRLCPGLTHEDWWKLELYEESFPTVQEGRAAAERFWHLAPTSFQQGKRFRESLRQLLPHGLRSTVSKHPYWKKDISGWFSHAFFSRRKESAVSPSKSSLEEEIPDRERDFNHFLSLPGFRSCFEAFWRKDPKNRSNHDTRALVVIGRIVACFGLPCSPAAENHLRHLLASESFFSEQTVDDVMTVARRLQRFSCPMHELAERLIIDTTHADRKNIVRLIPEFMKEISPGNQAELNKAYLEFSRVMAIFRD